MRIDVFTLTPHAYAWMTEQQPIAGVLGGELELRLLNYRDTTPLRAGQVDDTPYGGGAGMVDGRANMLATTNDLEKNSLDYYATLRSISAQRRAALVAEGHAGKLTGRADQPPVTVTPTSPEQ